LRISYLELKNYRRFRDLKLQFPDGIVGILGLNGVGKTTIIESIAWALFGNVEEVVRTSRESVRRAGAGSHDNCSAILEFELGGTEYRIEREMSGKSLAMKAELRSKGTVLADSDKAVRKAVEKLIGMDHKSFFTSVFARQKELNALQNVAAGERKKVVLRMLRIDGIDSVLADIRGDKRDTMSRIEGAEKTLLTEDGRERKNVLAERLPHLEKQFEGAFKELEQSEHREKGAARDAEVIRKRRDELKRDVDAYNASASDMKAKQSSIREMMERERSIASKISSAEVQLRRMPELEKAEAQWKQVSERKDHLEREKTRFEKAKSIREEIEAEIEDLKRRTEELSKLREGIGKPLELEENIADADKAIVECDASKADLTGKIGEANAKIAERRAAAEKDRKKLEEIKEAGKDGVCPTCERRLDEAYELLVDKLKESTSSAEKQAEETSKLLVGLDSELNTVLRKQDALRKKRSRLDQELSKLKQLEASASEKEAEMQKLRTRTEQRKKSLANLGEVSYSEEDYRKAKVEHEKLKLAHDDYTRMRSTREQMEHNVREQADIKASIAKVIAEEKTLADIVASLEPKKGLYEKTIKELDEKTASLNAAKDALRKASSLKEKAQSELESTKKDIDEIERVRKAIEDDRTAADDLSLLEDVVVNFRDNLIGRIAPALSELTSRGLGIMTEGKYSVAELDDSYEMQIDDQGTAYPVSRFSGGEADLANLSLRLAISSIIADRTGASPVNILILDEIFGSQDPNRKRSVMTALSRLSAQFRQIFLITHIEEVKDSMNYVIKVEEQEDGTSRAVLAS